MVVDYFVYMSSTNEMKLISPLGDLFNLTRYVAITFHEENNMKIVD